MQRCAECMPDSAKCRTAEQVPRAEERAFSFPASHSLAPCRSSKAGGGGGQAVGVAGSPERSAGVPCRCACPGMAQGGQRESPALGCFHSPSVRA